MYTWTSSRLPTSNTASRIVLIRGYVVKLVAIRTCHTVVWDRDYMYLLLVSEADSQPKGGGVRESGTETSPPPQYPLMWQ